MHVRRTINQKHSAASPLASQSVPVGAASAREAHPYARIYATARGGARLPPSALDRRLRSAPPLRARLAPNVREVGGRQRRAERIAGGAVLEVNLYAVKVGGKGCGQAGRGT